MFKLLLVCDTNTSLSPLLKAILGLELEKQGLSSKISLDSAGAFAGIAPRPLERRIQLIADKNNLGINEHLSKSLTKEDIDLSDMVVVMNEANFWFIKDLDPSVDGSKVRLIMEFTEQLGLREMPDPIQGQIKFSETIELLLKTATPLIAFIKSTYLRN